MEILVINGGCLTVNSSANLCHLAYIRGLVENGHNVTVLSTSEKGQIIDKSMALPKGPEYRTFERSILYNFINPGEWKQIQASIQNNNVSLKTRIVQSIKQLLQKLYGPFGYNGVWVNNVVRRFGTKKQYDCIISISSPVYSHLAAIKLIDKGKISCQKYIQIWEDPWQLDLYNKTLDNKLLKLEESLVSRADKVFYVSPLTAKYQAEMFKQYADKITWAPLPYYYKDDKVVDQSITRFGYFGDYFPVSRNLSNFYEAAKNAGSEVVICGSPDKLFSETEKIKIFPRLPLDELKKHEDSANILVFVCNLKGGQIPGKIYQYSATNKRILFILDGTEEEIDVIRSFFERFHRYYFCRNEIQDIERAIYVIERGGDSSISDRCVDAFSPKEIVNQILKTH